MLMTSDSATQPLQEIDRFFAAPRNRNHPSGDAQSEALARMIVGCERLRPHIATIEALDRFIGEQRDPARVRRRISLALALESPRADLAYGIVGRANLAAFRALAQRKLAAVIWVFS